MAEAADVGTDVTLEELRSYVNAGRTPADDADLKRALDTGIALVAQHLSGVLGVPASVVRQAQLVAASEVSARKNAPMGVSQFATTDGAPVRVNRDPMVMVYPILAPFIGPAIA